MTWFSTWPTAAGPDYKEHPTEQAAEQHAKSIVDSNRARVATVFQNNQLEEQE